jgi:mannosyl-oligosaccharide alpha-1,2-mannosidase
MLYLAFDTPSRLPINSFRPQIALRTLAALALGGETAREAWAAQGGPAQGQESAQASLAQLATMGLEFTKLSMLTGDMRFYDQAARVGGLLEVAQERTALAGLWPKHVDAARMPKVSAQTATLHGGNGNVTGNELFLQAIDEAFVREADEFNMGAESDSAYEYVPKMYLLLGGPQNPAAEKYLHMYSKFVDAATDRGMWFRPLAPGNPDVLLTGTLIARRDASQKPMLSPHVEHLGCFVGGMLGLGSRLVLAGGDAGAAERSKRHLGLAQGLTDGCAWAYAQTATGIGPEGFVVQPCSMASGPRGECLWDTSAPAADDSDPVAFKSITDPHYHLRPEAIESVFYLWRITGQKYLQDVAWDMFVAIESATATDHGNAEIEDVQAKGGGRRLDKMESFWMAETLKYFYLMFCDADVMSLDEWVLNTEAHPLKIPR